MGARIIAALFLAAVTTGSFTQNIAAPNSAAPHTAAPRLIVDLPSNVALEGAWIRYALYGAEGAGGRISSGGTLKTEPNSRRQELSTVFDGAPAHHAKLVIYVPGCQFGNYDIDLSNGSDTTMHFQCEPLSMRTIHGFLSPNEIPTNTYLAEKKLDITVTWMLIGYVVFFFNSDTAQPLLNLALVSVRAFPWAPWAKSIPHKMALSR